MRFKYFLHKVVHWEYWPQWLVYAPITPVLIYYFIKARSFFFNTAANPEIENGGYLMESKFDIHRRLPPGSVPLTIKITGNTSFREALALKQNTAIGFPCYCKPDIGGKGIGVQKVASEEELHRYHHTIGVDYLIQEAIPYKNEVGIFYCRLPGSGQGKITGIVAKKSMVIYGDGTRTIQQLIEAEPRYYFQRHWLYKEYAHELYFVPGKNQLKILSEIGNHARGSAFTDITAQNNPSLEQLIDSISKQFGTFYYGRYDILYHNWESLCAGEQFKIVELNGSGSEPTHIYDSNKSILQAWKIIIHHFSLMYRVASAHHKNGVAYAGLKKGILLNRAYKQHCRKINRQKK